MRDLMSPLGMPITVVLERMDEELAKHAVVLMNGRTWSVDEYLYWTRCLGPIQRNLKSMQAISVFDTYVVVLEVEPDHGSEKDKNS